MCAGLGLLQPELGTPRNHFDLVAYVVRERLSQVQRAWHAVDEGEHVDRKTCL